MAVVVEPEWHASERAERELFIELPPLPRADFKPEYEDLEYEEYKMRMKEDNERLWEENGITHSNVDGCNQHKFTQPVVLKSGEKIVCYAQDTKRMVESWQLSPIDQNVIEMDTRTIPKKGSFSKRRHLFVAVGEGTAKLEFMGRSQWGEDTRTKKSYNIEMK